MLVVYHILKFSTHQVVIPSQNQFMCVRSVLTPRHRWLFISNISPEFACTFSKCKIQCNLDNMHCQSASVFCPDIQESQGEVSSSVS